MTCSNCGEDMMYDRRDGERCANCGHIEKPTIGKINERPTKPHDAVCGEVVNEYPNHDDTIPKMIDHLCNDGTRCKFNPTTMVEDGDTWLAVCTTHRNTHE